MKSLKTLVIVLGALIVLSMGLLGWGFYTKLAGPDAAAVEETAPDDSETVTLDPLADFGDVRLDLPAGCTVVDMRPDGDRLYLRTGPVGLCEQILVIEASTGHVLGTIVIKP